MDTLKTVFATVFLMVTGYEVMAAPKVPAEKGMATYLMVCFCDSDLGLHMAI